MCDFSYKNVLVQSFSSPNNFSDDGTVTTFFEISPPISTYLVAFVVSEFPHLTGNTSRPILQRVYARRTAMNQTDLIFELSEPMLERMIDYFGVGYPLPKLDQIALPGDIIISFTFLSLDFRRIS